MSERLSFQRTLAAQKTVNLRIATGSIYGGAGATTVTFPSGRFGGTPAIVLYNQDITQFPIISAQSATSFTYSNIGGSNGTLVYIAILGAK